VQAVKNLYLYFKLSLETMKIWWRSDEPQHHSAIFQ